MTRLADIEEAELVAGQIKAFLIGRRCWYGYVSFGNTFQLALGKRVPRPQDELDARVELRRRRIARGVKPNRVVESRRRETGWDKFTGESDLLVWCVWRLDRRGGLGTSWDDEAEKAEAGIRSLIGQTVRSVEITSGWDLVVEFNDKFVLRVLPDHIGPSASFNGNWELWRPDRLYSVGTDLRCKVTDRDERPLPPLRAAGRWRAAPAVKVSR